MNKRLNMPGLSVRSRHIILYLSLPVLFLIIFIFLPLSKALVLSDFKTGEVLYCSPVKPGNIFRVSYIHSVNKSPVEDCFRIGDKYEIIIDKTIFKSFGAGVPASPEDGGELHVYNDRIEVTEINRRIDQFLLFIGVIAEHRFKMDDDEILLKAIRKPQTSVLIKVERIPLPTLTAQWVRDIF